MNLNLTRSPRWTHDGVRTQVNMALQKWKATIYEANMPPEAIIKALQERVARQRMLKEKFEGELEAIVQAETERAFANLDEDKKSLLIRILTRMMKIKQHGTDSA
jgi:hypothetical protein